MYAGLKENIYSFNRMKGIAAQECTVLWIRIPISLHKNAHCYTSIPRFSSIFDVVD